MTNDRNTAGGNNTPLIAYYVPDRRKGPWLQIGVAWPHKDGEGFNVDIELVPLEVFKGEPLKITVRQPKERQEDDAPDSVD